METEKTKPKIIKRIIVSLTVVIVVGVYVSFPKENLVANNVKVAFPYAFSVEENTSFACESLVSANIIGSQEEYLTNGIEGTVEKGTDKVAMNIKDSKTLSFLTGASIGIGVTEGDNFAIIENNNQKLMAVWFNENAISTIVLNKTNGLALWLKGVPDFPIYGAPHGSIIYLVCR